MTQRLLPRTALLTVALLAAVLTLLRADASPAAGLSIGIPTPATFSAGLGTSGNVETTGGNVVITGLGSWQLRVRGSDAGRLRSTGAGACTAGSPLLTNPLRVWATGSGVSSPGSSANPITLTGDATLLASGTVTALVTVGVHYRYIPSSQDQLPAACPYSLTTTIDLIA